MTKITITLLIIFSFSILVMSTGCKSGDDGVIPIATSFAEENESAPLDTSEGKLKGNSMAATVNGKVITQSEVDLEIRNLLQQFGGQVPPDQMAQLQPMLQKQALDNLINKTILLQKAEKDATVPDKKAVDTKIEEIKARFPSEEQYQAQLQGSGMTEETLRAELVKNLQIDSLLEKPLASVTPASAEETKKFYDDNPDEFKAPEQVKASHILIGTEQTDTDEQKAEKKAKLTEVKASIEKGAEFADMALQHSSCPSKSKGGDLGYFGRGNMVKPFEDAAFGMKVNEMSDVVETQFGYHLIKVTDRKEASYQTFDQVKIKITEYLTNQKKQEAVKAYIDELKKTATIEMAAS